MTIVSDVTDRIPKCCKTCNHANLYLEILNCRSLDSKSDKIYAYLHCEHDDVCRYLMYTRDLEKEEVIKMERENE